jgi:hypothetical protein
MNKSFVFVFVFFLSAFVATILPVKSVFSANNFKNLLVNLRESQRATINCQGQTIAVTQKNDGKTLELVCVPNQIPTPSPTITSAPLPTPTTAPTGALPVPLCTNHNDTVWHPLVERNADGSVKCTYGHEHHDDPKVLNGVFGPVGELTGGNEISYPWQTHSQAGDENAHKHASYKWNVVSVANCTPSNAPYGFKNIRAEFHQDGAPGALTRYHSYWLEAQACDPNDTAYEGVVKLGGFMDYGRLFVSTGDKSEVHVPLVGDPTSGDDRRLHMGIVNGVVPCCRNGDFTWYGSNRSNNVPGLRKVSVRNGLRGEDWGAIDPLNTSVIVFKPTMWYGSVFNGNNSWQEPMHLLNITVPAALDANDGVIDNKVTYSGFTDRYGNILTSTCSPLGQDCVPLYLKNMKVGTYQFRADANRIATREYDVLINRQSLIQYPN